MCRTHLNMNERHLAAHVLSLLSTAQTKGRPVTLEALCEALPVRRADLRTVVSKLHREGLVDVRTMRLTMSGFLLGQSLRGKKLPALRAHHGLFSRAA